MPRATLALFLLAACAAGCARAAPPAPVAPAPVAVPIASVAPPASAATVVATPRSEEPREAAIQPLADATCIVHDATAHNLSSVALTFHGKRFAFAGDADDVELRANDKAATMTTVSSVHVLTGEVRTNDLTLYTRAPALIDGWVAIVSASPRSITGDSATLAAASPSMLRPTAGVVARVPCRDLSLVPGPRREPAGKTITLKAGTKTTLRDAPSGATLATIETKPEPTKRPRGASLGSGVPSREAIELARKDGAVRIRIEGRRIGDSAYFEGWIDASAIGKAPAVEAMTMSLLGMLGSKDGAVRKTLTCPNDVPVWVRDGETVKVGSIRANAPLHPLVESKDEVTVEIGAPDSAAAIFGDRVETLAPFVKRAALEGCAEKKK